MWRALVWKEWRQQRLGWVVLMVGAVVLSFTVRLSAGHDLVWVFGPLIGLLAAGAIACHTFAAERADASACLVDRLPVPPVAVWLVKVGMAVTLGAVLFVLPWAPMLWGTPAHVTFDLVSSPGLMLCAIVMVACFYVAARWARTLGALSLAVVVAALAFGLWMAPTTEAVTFLAPAGYALGIPAALACGSYRALARWGHPVGTWRRRVLGWAPAAAVALWVVGFWWANWGSVPHVPEPFDVQAFLAGGVPPERNAAVVYRQAMAALPGWPTKPGQTPPVPHDVPDPLLDRYQLVDCTIAWSAVRDDARRVLQTCAPGLALARLASRMPEAEFCSPRTITWCSLMTDVQNVRMLTRLMQVQARSLYHAGKPAEAAGWLLTVYRMARHVRQRGCLIQALVGIACEGMAGHHLVRILDAPQWTPGTLRATLDEFRTITRVSLPPAEALKVEYLSAYHAYVDPIQPECIGGSGGSLGACVTWGVLWIEKAKSRAVINRCYDAVLTAVESGWPVRGPSRSPGAALQGLPFRSVALSMFARQFPTSLPPALAAYTRRRVRGAAVELALALALYRAEKGAYPDRLDKLVPDYLPALPEDPYASGQPFRYQRVPTQGITHRDAEGRRGAKINWSVADRGPKAWMLYSVAGDGNDNRGVLSWRYYKHVPGDWLVHLPGEPVPPQPKDFGPDSRDWGVLGCEPDY